jgi:hypothetical protein
MLAVEAVQATMEGSGLVFWAQVAAALAVIPGMAA